MISTDQKETLMISKQNRCVFRPQNQTSLTPDHVVNVTDRLLKGSNPTHVRQIKQCLLKHYFPRLPDRYLAELTGCKDHTGIKRNIKKVQSDHFLNEVVADLKDIFDTK